MKIRGPNWWTWIIVCGRYTLISLGKLPSNVMVYIPKVIKNETIKIDVYNPVVDMNTYPQQGEIVLPIVIL